MFLLFYIYSLYDHEIYYFTEEKGFLFFKNIEYFFLKVFDNIIWFSFGTQVSVNLEIN